MVRENQVSLSLNKNNAGVQQSTTGASGTETNRPRNLLVTDATQPFSFAFTRYGQRQCLTVQQTSTEEFWPGGAIWDVGVLMAQVLVAVANKGQADVTLTTHLSTGKVKDLHRTVQIPDRVMKVVESAFLDAMVVVELGCGVGLTGLVAAAALPAAKITVLTDLKVVIEGVTQANVFRTIQKSRGIVQAMPLCWGDSNDEQALAAFLRDSDVARTTLPSRRSPKSDSAKNHDPVMPDLILIGDVAYQHKPGAPSHFEALHSTLLRCCGDDTLVVFGTRLRMPASIDLLNLLVEDFEQLVKPLIADEIDLSFSSMKHNMSIHFLRKKRKA